jgi:ABC-type glycerol-3-phosphate transport system substrate-binding protein
VPGEHCIPVPLFRGAHINIEVAKDFLKYFIQPEVLKAYLKAGLGRHIPCMPSIAKDDL